MNPSPDDAPNDDELLLADLRAALADARPPTATILAAASARRPVKQPADGVATIGAVDAYDRIHRQLDALLSSLPSARWEAAVPFYGWWTIRGLVAHLVAIDRYFAGCLGLTEPTVDETAAFDHVGITLDTVRAWTASPAATLATWRDGAARVRAFLHSTDADLRRRMKFHMLDTRLETVLMTRVFELWTHVEDIHRALGAPLPPVDPELLHRMSRLAVPAVPLGLLLQGVDLGAHTVRFVLTGPGGGTFDQGTQVGQTITEPELVIVADVTEFCRVAGQRLEPDALECDIEGDAALAAAVLRGAAAFAS